MIHVYPTEISSVARSETESVWLHKTTPHEHKIITCACLIATSASALGFKLIELAVGTAINISLETTSFIETMIASIVSCEVSPLIINN